jgi:fused signal recognition particle receptor
VEGAPHETLLVLDATVGQNALRQASQFNEALALTGLVLAKLDSTAKGGVVVALKEELDLPVKLVGTGEGIDDLEPFDARAFSRACWRPDPAPRTAPVSSATRSSWIGPPST